MKTYICQLLLIILSVQFLSVQNPVYAKKEKSPEKKHEYRNIPVEIHTNKDCPVSLVKARAKAELDDYGSPLKARFYIKYKNDGVNPIAAVRFRLNYLNDKGVAIGHFHATHAAIIAPGATAEGKWKGSVGLNLEKVNVSTLLVRFPEGKDWKSKKMLEIEKKRKEIEEENKE